MHQNKLHVALSGPLEKCTPDCGAKFCSTVPLNLFPVAEKKLLWQIDPSRPWRTSISALSCWVWCILHSIKKCEYNATENHCRPFKLKLAWFSLQSSFYNLTFNLNWKFVVLRTWCFKRCVFSRNAAVCESLWKAQYLFQSNDTSVLAEQLSGWSVLFCGWCSVHGCGEIDEMPSIWLRCGVRMTTVSFLFVRAE